MGAVRDCAREEVGRGRMDWGREEVGKEGWIGGKGGRRKGAGVRCRMEEAGMRFSKLSLPFSGGEDYGIYMRRRGEVSYYPLDLDLE